MAPFPNAIKQKAIALGFDACGIARADVAWPATARLAQFIADGRHGEMGWMEETAARRGHPQSLWPDAKSAIMLGVNYAGEDDPLAALEKKDRAAISQYARRRDYHDLIKSKLKQLARWLAEESGAEVKVFVDTAPLMEKPLAQNASIGWQGKHTNLVSRQFGSWLFLGAILTDAALPADEPEADHCGGCRACLDICPTAAFPAPYQLDARRCIAYLTIEHEGPIPEEFRAAIGNRVFGCDDCLAVCPWNKFAEASRDGKLALNEALADLRLADLAELNDAAFRARFAGTPIKRTGRDRFVRNVLIAIGNSGEAKLTASAEARLS
ncbi:MAG: tRNA epoxyqueuosine(34) reductase QueG, partial [Pseudomonadota bacterium]